MKRHGAVKRSDRANIVNSFLGLNKNGKLIIGFLPTWAIPYSLFYIYQSLYMKSKGLDIVQIGYVSAIGFLAGAVFGFFASTIVNTLGRKRALLLVDAIFWPLTLLAWMFAQNIWFFIIAAIFNGGGYVGSIAILCLLTEDADSKQMASAFNLQNICMLSASVFTPLAGAAVYCWGLERSMQVFYTLALITYPCMALIRNRYLAENSVSVELMRQNRSKSALRNLFHKDTVRYIFSKPALMLILLVNLLYGVFIASGSFTSGYYALYLTEKLGMSESIISTFSFTISGTMLIVFLFVVPALSGRNTRRNLAFGLCAIAVGLLIFLLAPAGNYLLVALSCVVYAVGVGVAKPFLDTEIASTADGEQRANMYSFNMLIMGIINSCVGFGIGYVFKYSPALVYTISLVLVLICLLIILSRRSQSGGKRVHRAAGESDQTCL